MSKKVDKVRMRFAGLAAQWLASIAQGVKESTLAHYYYTLQRYLLPVFGETELSALDEQRLEQGILQAVSPADGSHRPLGASSARECLTMLRRICKYAAHLHLMRPVEIVVKLPQFERRQTVPLSAQEQANLRDFVLEHPTARKAGLLLQMQLGLRIGEVCGMHVQPSGIKVGRMRVPLGVLGIIYESRPNVTVDAAALAIKSGNVRPYKVTSGSLVTEYNYNYDGEVTLIKTGASPCKSRLISSATRITSFWICSSGINVLKHLSFI